MSNQSAHSHAGEHGLSHVASPKVLIGTFVTLLILTVVTVAVAQAHLANLALVVALIVAAIKATVVALYFMHLKYDKRFNVVVICSAILFIAVFVGFALWDSHEYQPDVVRYRIEQKNQTIPPADMHTRP